MARNIQTGSFPNYLKKMLGKKNVKLSSLTFNDLKWFNKPISWRMNDNVLQVTTDMKTDFWMKTWNNCSATTGHVFGIELVDDFTVMVCLEAEFTTPYDQAGLMLYVDEKHWLKAGIEYNDGQPMMGSVLTNEVSDWATGLYPGVGSPVRCWIKLSKVGNFVCVKSSTDKRNWTLMRLAPFPAGAKYFVGPMCCTPKRAGLHVKFTDLEISEPVKDVLHGD